MGGIMNVYKRALQKIKQDEHCKVHCINQVITSGKPGPTGPTGPAPEFQIGNVTTGAPGTGAEVKITKL